MKTQTNQSHATETQLALLAAGELGLIERLRVRWHVNSCENCRQELASFEEARAIAENAGAQLPEGLDWARLSAEMSANIRLGVEAGECVRPALREVDEVPEPKHHYSWQEMWRPAMGVAAVVITVFAGSWMMNRKIENSPAAMAQGVVLQAQPDALVIQDRGAQFSLVRASASIADVSLGSGGSLRAQDIDDETGQVTIYHVYAQ